MPDAGPFVLVLAAHPDDEVIGAGAQLMRWKDPMVAHLTDGAPRDMHDATAHGFRTREEYAHARCEELLCALALANIGPGQVRRLGFMDQEASYELAEAARRVCDLLRELKPDIVVTHPYEGGHPDHDAVAFATHAARRLLMARGEPRPEFREFACYFGAHGRIVTGRFIPQPLTCETQVALSERERETKRRMLECFVTQRETLRPFQTDFEWYRPAPRYDFTLPPSDSIYYDAFRWGIKSEDWREQARQALQELGIAGPI